MFDMAQVQTAVSALSAVRDLIKVGVDAKADAQAQAKVIDAMGKLGDAQDAMYALRDELYRLQSEVATLKLAVNDRAAFDKRMEAYELVKTTGGALVHKFKGDPVHYACPNCVNKHRIEILQDNRTMSGKYRCTAAGCAAEFPVDVQRRHAPGEAIPTTHHWSGN